MQEERGEELKVFKVVLADDIAYKAEFAEQDDMEWLLLKVTPRSGESLNIAFLTALELLRFCFNLGKAVFDMNTGTDAETEEESGMNGNGG